MSGGMGAQEKEPRLPGLLKMLVWAQDHLDEKLLYPVCENLLLSCPPGCLHTFSEQCGERMSPWTVGCSAARCCCHACCLQPCFAGSAKR